MYDLIIIGGGASGLFCSINAPKKYKKLILEKQSNLGTKILLSGGGRCNFTNLNIDPDKYFGQNKKMLDSIFHKYSNYDFMNYLNQDGIEYKVEDNGRVVLKSGKAKELLDFLIQKSKENHTKIQTGQIVQQIEKLDDYFKITTKQSEFFCKNLVISTGGISHPQTGTDGFGIQVAKQFGLKTVPSFPALCGIETQKDFSNLSGSSIVGYVQALDGNKIFYENKGNVLFTHRGLSGPAIFNTSAGIAEYLTKISLHNKDLYKENKGGNDDKSFAKSMEIGILSIGQIYIKLTSDQLTKKLKNSKLFSDQGIQTEIKNFRSLQEAKVSSGGVDMSEIKPNFECKKIPNLYFIGETLDIIGETGGFNLQRAWSSGAICGKNL